MGQRVVYARKTIWGLFKILALLFAVTGGAFMLVLFSPNDPVESFLSKGVTTERRAVIERAWGLDRPPIERYIIWVDHASHGDLGESIVYSQPVKTVIGTRMKATLALLGSAWVISGVLGFVLGVFSGVYRGSFLDTCIKRFCLILASAPVFWLGLMAVMLFAVQLKLFPMGLASPAGKVSAEVTIGEYLYHLILPAFTLGLSGISKIALTTRAKMIDIIDSNYMNFARARGETLWETVRNHGLRNVILPSLTLQFNSFNEIFSGSVLAEQVFSYPGLGQAATTAGLNGDANLLLGVTLVSTIFVVCGNLIADSLYGLFDPQMKGGKNG